MSLIEINDVHKSFGDVEVLKGIDISIGHGEVLAIIGKSGSGKSTLLRCINGLETIDRGSITIGGNHLHGTAADLRRLRLQVGMIFQQFNLFPHLTAGRNVMLAQTVVKKTSESEAEAVARDVLASVGLSDKFDVYPDKLSGGQQQRVAIARSLAMKPVALLCDEITSALDPELVGEVLAVVRSLARGGMTLAMVTHEMQFAREVCDRVIFMHEGRVHETGAPEDVFDAPKTAELRQFLGMANAT
ncbi:amino acid ABC transporter ATP-binding protein [uncultured Martelella sp.]|uniref:amino acid ABC transporter ATP-binding protein n=1 Tax=uncultured Martelella sp. TaxID=392331 RepID=UPI0029C886F1|nr:amino acid ABC transporter ATP-binding protein [uncultured Martelella sp.]